MSSHGRDLEQQPQSPSPTEEEEKQEQKKPLVPPPRAARTYFIPIPSATAEMRQDWLERLNVFVTLCGAALILAGACAIVLPVLFSITVQTLTRWLLVAAGIIELLHFLLLFGAPATTSFLLLGALNLGVGLWMVIVSSTHQFSTFYYIMTAWFAAHGIIKFLMTCQLRTLTTWPVLLVSGVLAILCGAVHFAFTDNWGLTFFSILFGADLAFTGFAFFLIALMACLASRASSTQEPLLEEAGYHAAHANSP